MYGKINQTSKLMKIVLRYRQITKRHIAWVLAIVIFLSLSSNINIIAHELGGYLSEKLIAMQGVSSSSLLIGMQGVSDSSLDIDSIPSKGILMLSTAWQYGSYFYDQSGHGNTATPSFPTGSSDPDVSSNLSSFQPVAQSQAPAYAITGGTGFISTNITATGNFTTNISPTFPGKQVIEALAVSSGTPTQLPFVLISGFVLLVCSLLISSLLKQHGVGSGNLFVKIAVITVVMGILVAVQLLDLWILIFFLMMAIAIAMMSQNRG